MNDEVKWIAELRSNNPQIKIVPRFMFEGWSSLDIERFLLSEVLQIRCLRAVTEFLLRNEMEGAVIEIWLQILSETHGDFQIELVELIVSWADEFHKNSLEIIITLPLPLINKNEFSDVVTPEDFDTLSRHVDFINLMAYDYRSTKFEGVAPLDWIRNNIEFLTQMSPKYSNKILMGLNFYGYIMKEGRLDPIINDEYIELIKSNDAILNWNSVTKEHFITSRETRFLCYFPTVTSIKYRLMLAKQMNVGIGIWEIGQGLNYFTKLLCQYF
ncbi:unnamed protein product [Dracunculus medinensis]|uniref:Chitinase domain-containing protein 1 n=1 Tax=Dracunculus medinensis TaxID=318479 RepID=A0A0N4UC98_DRAME|nr:unnamed protein product [Dracunculus medinensis]